MNLFVRSQNKKFLVKADELSVQTMSNGEYIYNGNAPLGKYDTKKRCIEILDEIATILNADPVPVLVFADGEMTMNLYDELNKAYKNGDLLAVYTPNKELKVFEKSTAVYQMPEK